MSDSRSSFVRGRGIPGFLARRSIFARSLSSATVPGQRDTTTQPRESELKKAEQHEGGDSDEERCHGEQPWYADRVVVDIDLRSGLAIRDVLSHACGSMEHPETEDHCCAEKNPACLENPAEVLVVTDDLFAEGQ